jgi:Putative auto-transporter adhesin, head GIN domain
MKNISLVILLLFSMANTVAQEKKSYNLSSFTAINASNSVKITYTQNELQKIDVIWEKENLPFLKIEEENGVLHISIENKGNKKSINTKNLEIFVSSKYLNKINLSNSAVFTVKNTLEVDVFDLNISTSALFSGNIDASSTVVTATTSALFTGKISCSNTILNAYTSANINVSGSTDSLTIDATSSSYTNAKDFTSANAKVSSNTSATVKVFASDNIEISANTSATVDYYGGAENVTIDKNTSGTVNKKS